MVRRPWWEEPLRDPGIMFQRRYRFAAPEATRSERLSTAIMLPTLDSSSDVELFNPSYNTTDSFPHFNRLPRELRYEIWELALSHERFLHVKLQADPPPPPPPFSDLRHTEQSPPRTIVSPPDEERGFEKFSIIFSERQPISKLFHVNSESRSVALRFYRVQLPCQYHWGDRREENGTFYFHPELDTLEIEGQEYFVDFAHRIWVNDVKRVGLINLTLNTVARGGVPELFNRQRLRSMDPVGMQHVSKQELTLFQSVFGRLKRVVFMYMGGVERMFFGEPRPTYPFHKYEIHRSRPTMAPIMQFKRLKHDPRSIQEYLKRVYMGCHDPREDVHLWLRLLRQWGVRHDHKVDYSFVVAHGTRLEEDRDQDDDFTVAYGWRKRLRTRMTDRQGATQWARDRDDLWRAYQKYNEESGSRTAEQTKETMDKAAQPVLGFWLFPIEALGPLPDINLLSSELRSGPDRFWQSHRKMDLSNYQPELCIFHLP